MTSRCRSIMACSISAVIALPSAAFAGGFDLSGRPFGIIFDGENKDNELRVTYQEIHIESKGSIQESFGSANQVTDVEDVAPSFSTTELAVRAKLSESSSCAGRYEQPFYADIRYDDDSLAYTESGDQYFAPIDSRYESESITLACRYSWKNSEHAFHIFAGPKYQKIKGAFSSDLSDFDIAEADNLEVTLDGGGEWGYITGVAYEIPAIAAMVSVIYHNEINYDLTGTSITPLGDFSGRIYAKASGKTATPQSVHLNLQTGVAQGWLVFTSLKWSEWGEITGIQVTDNVGNPSLGLFNSDTLDFDIGFVHAPTNSVRLGASYISGMKLGSDKGPRGADGVNLRDPLGKRHTLLVGGKLWLSDEWATDLALSYTVMEKKRIFEERNAGTIFIADFDSEIIVSAKLGVSWHF